MVILVDNSSQPEIKVRLTEKTGETELVPFAVIEHGPQFSGSLTSYPFGQEILMHRYQTDATYDAQTGSSTQGKEQDGLLSLAGDIRVIPDQWGTIRSKNGRYEVVYPSDGNMYTQENTKVVVTDRATDQMVTEFSSALLLI